MFDFMRNLAKPAAEKEQERLHAYVDGELSAAEQQAFEQQLVADPALQAEVESLRELKAQVRALPRVKAPRHFTLDAAAYGRPEPDRVGSLLPALRVATALTAILFVAVLALDLVRPMMLSETAAEPFAGADRAAQVAETVEVEGEPVEVTRIVVETVVEAPVAAELEVEEVAEDTAGEAALADEAASELAEEEAMEEEAADAFAPEATLPSEEMESPAGEAYPAPALPPADADTAYPPPTLEAAAGIAAYVPPPTSTPSGAAQATEITADEITTDEITTDTPPEDDAPVTRAPISGLRLVQVLSGLLLLSLLAVLLFHRRR